MNRINTVAELDDLQDTLKEGRSEGLCQVTVCGGTGCRAYGSEKVWKAFEAELGKLQPDIDLVYEVKPTGCHGFCEKGPLVVIRPQEILYVHVQVKDVPEIIQETLVEGKIIERLLYTDPVEGQKIIHEEEVPFYKHQHRFVLGLNGIIDPAKIEDYIAQGGYQSLKKTLTSLSPQEVIDEVKQSGLRGRGGAGFTTGVKWELCRNNVQTSADGGYIICNADEGDPGAYMDRSVMEGNPHSVIEGMIIGAYAIGVHQGFVYIRAEYPLAVQNLRAAIQQAEAAGLLGEDILGSGFDFRLGIRLGAGAFVCGEETALMASIESRTGEPRPRPPYPAQSGLWGKPSNINNVETWANIPLIIARSGQEYAALGTQGSKGTKIFSLVGKINNTGLVEVPMGITLREIVYDIGGGIPNGKRFKAAQLGGPSGGCIPAEHLDTQIDYESLKQLGAIMGSGGMVIADEDTCMVDFARYFMSFTQEESCGKCVPCRVGTKAMLDTLERICAGEGTLEDIDYLEELGNHIKEASLCGLGQTAPNPVLSTIRYFREEYEAHILDKTCPAKVCKALITYHVDESRCTGCTACLRACPAHAIYGELKEAHFIDEDLCIRCGMCMSTCRFDAIEVV
jgi:NADH:ubiquinone oxidoreductase subunit F (NADH-binding)/(2Fe-2S) ferredoxin/Pyruvate/2-oxoacid:ferredoxin oxidoreductase delta subunit